MVLARGMVGFSQAWNLLSSRSERTAADSWPFPAWAWRPSDGMCISMALPETGGSQALEKHVPCSASSCLSGHGHLGPERVKGQVSLKPTQGAKKDKSREKALRLRKVWALGQSVLTAITITSSSLTHCSRHVPHCHWSLSLCVLLESGVGSFPPKNTNPIKKQSHLHCAPGVCYS